MDQFTKRRMIVTGGMALLTQTLLGGCGWRKPPMIGLMLDDMGVERWARDRDYFVAEAKKLGAGIIVKWANRDAENQVRQFRDLIEKKVDVIVLLPLNGEVIFTEPVKAARAAGIKVIAYDRMIFNADIDAYVSVDSDAIGLLQIEEMLRRVPKGNYFLLGGDESDGNTRAMRKVHLARLQPYVERGDIKIVGMSWVDKWEPATAGEIINDALEKKLSIDAVVASNDGTAGGVIEVLRAHGLAGKVAVSGQDADLDACRRVLKGSQSLTVYKHLKDLAALAAGMAVGMARDEPQKFDRQLDNGFKKVDACLLKPTLLTRENIELLVKEGVYTRAQLGLG